MSIIRPTILVAGAVLVIGGSFAAVESAPVHNTEEQKFEVTQPADTDIAHNIGMTLLGLGVAVEFAGLCMPEDL